MGKTPRLDQYLRLIFRFYEALYLLDTLGRVRGTHHTANLDLSTNLGRRWRFLKNLAFLCDYMKGGPSTAAVAVEDRAECNVFWISSNEGPSDAIGLFLNSVITAVKQLHVLPEGQKAQAEDDLTAKCVEFASKKVKKQAHGLSNSAKKYRQTITASLDKSQHWEGERYAELTEWLLQFEYSTYGDLRQICQEAYDARNNPNMDLLPELSRESGTAVPAGVKAAGLYFHKARHIIGRLAHRIRAVKEIIEDSKFLTDLLDVFKVAVVTPPASVQRPDADGHTNLSGILTRIVGSDHSERFLELHGYLSDMDEQVGLEKELQEKFDSGKSSPVVHAEIQMLHHFYDNRLMFSANDAYIATSKPACFCCKLYFRHHPAGCAEPDTHEKVYPNWGPIYLPKGRNNPNWLEHRRLISKVIDDVAKEVLKEIDQRRRQNTPLHREHPDTLTALTVRSHTFGDDSSDSEFEDKACDEELNAYIEDDSDSDSDGGAYV